MDRDDAYSLISVNAGDDEEIVIQTGVRRTGRERPEPAEELDAQDAAFAEGEPETVEPALDADQAVVPEPEEDPAPRSSKPRYRETTKEDLETVEPMSKMQKIVIGCVFLFIVGFVAYYLFMR